MALKILTDLGEEIKKQFQQGIVRDRQPIQLKQNLISQFGQSALGKGITNLQQGIENKTLPRIKVNQFFDANKIKAPVPRMLGQFGTSIADEILNIPQRLFEGGGRIGTQIVRPLQEGRPIQGRQAIGAIASTAEPLFDIATLGSGIAFKNAGKQGLKSVIKNLTTKEALTRGGLVGAGYGATFGGLRGLSEGNEASFTKGAQGATLGAIFGGALGGGAAGVGRLAGLIKRTPEVDKQLRDSMGKYVTGDVLVKPKGMTKVQWDYQLKFNKKYNRNPYTLVSAVDLSKSVQEELEKKGAGLSIRDVSKDIDPLGTRYDIAGVRDHANKILRLMGDELKDINIVGSTARGKINPNDLDIIISTKKGYSQAIPSTELHKRTELSNLFKKELQQYFPGKKLDINMGVVDPKRGASIPLEGLNQSRIAQPTTPIGGVISPSLSKQQIQSQQLQGSQAGLPVHTQKVGTELNPAQMKQESLPLSGSIAQSVEASPQTLNRVRIRTEKAQAQQAQREFNEWQKQVLAEEGGTRTTTGAVRDASRAVGGGTRSMAAKDISDLKDISSPSTHFVDVFRNFRKVYGKKYEDVKRVVLDPLFIKGKTGMLNDQEMWIKRISSEVEEGFGIKKGSKQSADVQKYGEGLIDKAGLVSKYGREGASTIVKADKWFRKNYDQLLDEVNAVRAKIYPNNPDRIIPKRKDYYRHFQELSQGIDGLLNTLGRAIDVSPDIAGISFKTKPKSKWLSFAQRRLGGKTEFDAVGGFIDYVKAQTYAKHIDPHIDTFRQLSREIGEAGVEEGKGLNNFSLFLERFADDLAGKTNPTDRFLQEIGSRKGFAVLNWFNQRTKANVILGNASSALAQIFNLPNGIAEAGPQFATKGFARTLGSMFAKNNPMDKSVFLRERYFRGFDKFDRSLIDNGRKFSAWMITALDEVGSKLIWNMQYEKALAHKIANPVNYADDVTRRMVGGRGIGEMSLIQRSKAFQLVAPFQLEVTNAWHVIGDMIGEKAFGKLATLAVTSYIMNRAAEEIRGSDVSFDPINAVVEGIEAFNEEENKGTGALRFGGRVGGEVLSNVPFGQTVAAIYPEYGNKDVGLPTREQLFGKGDPTRYGSGLLATKGLQDPLFKLIPPFGGQQLKRTIEGIGTTLKGYSETPSGDVRFPTDNDPLRNIQRAIFGQYSTPEAREYFDKDRRPLGENQTEVFKNLGDDSKAYYNDIIQNRELEEEVNKAKEAGMEFIGKDGKIDSQTPSTVSTQDLSPEQIKAKEDIAKAKVELNGGVIWVGDKIIFSADGEAKSVDISPPTKGTGIGAFANRDWNITKARDIWNANLSKEDKDSAFKKLGVEAEDVRYDALANYSVDIKTQYVMSKSPNKEKLIENLLTGRVRSIGDNIFASDGVIDNLIDEGLLTKEEGKALKALDYDNKGKLIKKTVKGKKAAKFTIRRISPAKISFSGTKVGSAKSIPTFKLSSGPVRVKPNSRKTFKIKTPERTISYRVVTPQKIKGLDSSIRLV